jgi:O-succinylbenzoic acid--CoA ligase
MTETVSHIAMQRLNGTKKSEVFELLPTYSVSLNNENCLVIDCPTLFPTKVTTNDVAQLFSNGFKWLGRKDNVINSGGIKLSPEAIEGEIKKYHPELTFYITSKKDDTLGEKVILVSEKEIQFNFDKMELDRYQIPREVLIEKVTKTETGKLKRKKF